MRRLTVLFLISLLLLGVSLHPTEDLAKLTGKMLGSTDLAIQESNTCYMCRVGGYYSKKIFNL